MYKEKPRLKIINFPREITSSQLNLGMSITSSHSDEFRIAIQLNLRMRPLTNLVLMHQQNVGCRMVAELIKLTLTYDEEFYQYLLKRTFI